MENLKTTENKPLISIIIPVLNLQDLVGPCLDSVINQTYKNLEILVIDNGSTDNTKEVLSTYAKNDKRIVVLDCKEKGVSKARNLGLKNFSGEFLCFVDGDDIIEKDYVKDLYEHLEHNKCDMSICSFKKQKKLSKFAKKTKVKETFVDGEEAIKKMLCSNQFNGIIACKMFKREFLKDIFFDEEIYLCEDLLFCFEYLLKCNSVVYFNKKLYHYLIRPNGAVMGRFSNKKLTCLKSLEKIISMTQNEEIKACAKAWMCMQCVMLLYFCKRDKIEDVELNKKLHSLFEETKIYAKQSKYLRPLYKNNIDVIGLVIKRW